MILRTPPHHSIRAKFRRIVTVSVTIRPNLRWVTVREGDA